MFTIHHGDCLAVLSVMLDNSVDSIVTDPPYGLSFMGKKWDYDVPSVEIWAECLRILKPGGHLLAFAGTRTQHRMAVNIEDAGFEIRDMVSFLYDTNETAQTLIESLSPEQLKLLDATFGRDGMLAWTYGSGFPKSLNLDGEWQGWGTALKPALEPITMARKPLAGTVAANVLAHGTGVINIDGCRVASDEELRRDSCGVSRIGTFDIHERRVEDTPVKAGRWPANLIHDGSDEVLTLFPGNAGASAQVRGTEASAASNGKITGKRARVAGAFHGDSGSAARFFYCPKASKKDRDEGLEQLAQTAASEMVNRADGSAGMNSPRAGAGRTVGARNHHPTVKPTELMRYLCRLVTPLGGVVLDPFMGSGSTGKAALREGFTFIGIEREADYVALAEARLAAELQPEQDNTGTD